MTLFISLMNGMYQINIDNLDMKLYKACDGFDK